MDLNSFRSLVEAYKSVHAPQEVEEAIQEADSIAAMRERAAKRRKQRYGASDTSRGGRDDFRPYTKADYERGEANDPRKKVKEELEATGLFTEKEIETILEADVQELYKGKHGQTEKEYQDSRSDAGKMVSGDSKRSGAAYSSRAIKNSGPNPAGGSKKPQGQGRMTSGARADLEYRKANMNKG